MSRLKSWLNSIQLRQALTIFLVGIVFLSTACSSDVQATSRTQPTTPEAGAYQTGLKGANQINPNNLSQALGRSEIALIGNAQIAAADLPRNRDQAARRAQENAASAGKNQFAKSKQKTGNALENVREKLNLDEATEGTKQSVQSIGDKAGQAAKNTQQAVEDTAKSTQRSVQDTTSSS